MIIGFREVKQVCSDLLEYSVGSKGTGSELESILSLNASGVPLCILLRPFAWSPVPLGLAGERLSGARCLSVVSLRAASPLGAAA